MIKKMYFDVNLFDEYKRIFDSGCNYENFNTFLKEKSYEIIKNSNCFDETYYYENYPDVKELKLDPINHYLKYGFSENCNPNKFFNTKNYFEFHKNELNGLNPFVHYILYSNGDLSNEILNELDKTHLSTYDLLNINNAFEKEITIVIPIYNAYEDTKKCIESVLEHTTLNFHLILINDNSTDSRIYSLLNKYEIFPNIEIIHNESNQGFTKNVNLGIKRTNNDVILLNSDTLVTPRWVQKIIFAAYSNNEIGTVTPISNASDISVPIRNQNNKIPSFLNVNTMSLLVEKVSANGNLIAPTGNGFCLFIKRDLINDIGLFDEENFDKGYGEETDFTMRAKANGWKNVRNDSIFIYHKRSASFSLSNAQDLKLKHRDILLERYPKMYDEWNEFVESSELSHSIQNVKKAIDEFNGNLTKENILYLTIAEDNVPKINNIDKLNNKHNIFVLTLNGSLFKLWMSKGDYFIFIRDIDLNSKSSNLFYMKLLLILNIDRVFLQINDSFKSSYESPINSFLRMAYKLGLKIRYGSNSSELINPLIKYKTNKEYLLDNIITKNEMGVVYTAVGSEDELFEPKFIDEDLDYICFTDNPNLKSETWNIKLIDDLDFKDVRKRQSIKILPHKYLNEYDYSIWVDASFQIMGDIKQFINRYSTGELMLGNLHFNRDCIYEYAKEFITNNKNDEEIITEQINHYKQNNFPEHYGIIETGVLFRRHNNLELINLMEEWYSEVINFSEEDQISLPYILWKNNFKIDKSRIFHFKNNFFEHFNPQNLYANDAVRIILINENSLETKKTIDSIKQFTNIPISVMDFDNNNFVDLNIDESYLIFMYSGDLITCDLVEYLSNIKTHNLSNVGAITFDAQNYYSTDISEIYMPNFSPELYLDYDYIKNAVLFNKKIVDSIDGFDFSLNKNFIKDCLFRLYNNGYSILKEDFVGFKLKNFNDNEDNSDEEFLDKLITTSNLNAKIIKKDNVSLSYDTCQKKVSIIIPFKDQPKNTEKCILSILNNTEYTNYEIILVNNNSYEDETCDFINKFKNHEKIKLVNYADEFNYSKLNNYATKFATGDVFIFMNNNLEVISNEWLNLFIGDAIQKDVGVVGAKLYYSNKFIEHNGIVIGLNGLAGYLFNGEPDDAIPNIFKKFKRNVSAVTGQCMAIEKEVFDKIGGFEELFENVGADIEICLRLLNKGYRNVINPNINLIHLDKKVQSIFPTQDIDIKLLSECLSNYLPNGDLYFNSNFSLNSNNLILKDLDEKPVYEKFLRDHSTKNLNHKIKMNKITQSIKEQVLGSRIKHNDFILEYDVTKEELVDNAILMNNFFKNPNLELNTALWFIPRFDHIIRGGIYTIFRIANHFCACEKTHNIFVLTGANVSKINIEDIKKQIEETFPNLSFDILDIDDFEEISDLPESDAAFCTLWTTAYSLVKYNNCKAKFYLNQDYEPLFYEAGSIYGLIEETYRFHFIGLANTKGVKDKYESYGNVVHYFTPAIDNNTYFPGQIDDSKKRVVFYGRPNKDRNGFLLGIEALKIVKAYFGDSVEIYSAGAEFDVNAYGLNGVVNNLGLLGSLQEVADLYRKCDVGLVFMFTPHPSYQPFEYMACGCATVTNINEGNIWLLKDKENCILSEPAISCIAENIINLLNDDLTRNKIIKNGIKTVEKLDWDTELDNIIKFIKSPL